MIVLRASGEVKALTGPTPVGKNAQCSISTTASAQCMIVYGNSDLTHNCFTA